MGALSAPRLEDELVVTMRAMWRAGFDLIPLGGGEDGKAPLRGFEGVRLSLRQVMGPMGRKGSGIYGIRLSGLVVLDCDVDDPVLVAALEARFGPSAVHTRSSRGLHLWFRDPGCPLPYLKGEGLPVDVKSGLNSYVAGPGSVRPDGACYVPAKGDLAKDRLTPLLLHVPGRAHPHRVVPRLEPVEGGKVPVGQRHAALIKEAVRAVHHAPSLEDLTMHLRLVVNREYASPATMPDTEIGDAAGFAWGLRLNNSLWGPDRSTFRMSREVRAALKGKPYGKEAWWLLSTLVDAHGHIPGRTFVLNREAMNQTGLDLSERPFKHARDLLEAEGLIHRAKGHRAGHSRAQWRLGRPGPWRASGEGS